MNYDLLIINGQVVTAGQVLRADLAVKQGRIAAWLAPGHGATAETVIDAAGKHILPGLVDVHVHAGHGNPERETFSHASRAAAAGGITTFLEQPLSTPSTTTLQALMVKKAEATQQSVVDFGLWGGLVPGNGQELAPLFNAGGQAFKAFMCRSSNYQMCDDGTLLQGMQQIASLGGLLAVHAENDTLISKLEEDMANRGIIGVEAYLGSHPPYTELEAIERFLFLARQAPRIKAHLVHMSIPQGLGPIARAKAEGVDITVETCPQYLSLTDDDLRAIGGVAKCDPPVRSQALVEELWRAVLRGEIDMIASDHAPHPWDKKDIAPIELERAAYGVTGLQTMLPVMLTEGVRKRGLSLTRLVQLCCENPARRFGLYPRKGTLSPGSDADLVIIDLDHEWTCHAEDMHYLNKHTPYAGRVFTGAVKQTFVRGKLVCDNNRILVDPGFGQYIPLLIGDQSSDCVFRVT